MRGRAGFGRAAARTAVVVAALAAAVAPGNGFAATRAAEPGPGPERYLDPVFDEVTETTDVVYRQAVDAQGNLVDLHLDVYEPTGDTAEARPAVVWIHGGFFSFGNKSYMASYGRAFAERGYVSVSIQYRLRPGISTPTNPQLVPAALDAYEDARAALDWLRAHAEEYRIDPEAIAVGGHSAGAITALNVAYKPDPPDESNAQAAISIAGLTFGQPDPGEPPSIMFHGTADTTVPYQWGQNTCNAVNAAGLLCEMVTYPGDGHMIAYTVGNDIVERAAAFLAQQVLEPRGYFNDAPAAEAGGPYEVTEGSTVALDAAVAADPAGDPRPFEWSPAGSLDDAPRAPPAFTGADDGTETLTLSVADTWGATTQDSADVTVTNVAPRVENVVDLPGKLPGPRRKIVLAAIADPGALDTHTARIDWGDGTASDARVLQVDGGAIAAGRHLYRRFGVYRVTVTVTDDDGGAVSASHRLRVRPAP